MLIIFKTSILEKDHEEMNLVIMFKDFKCISKKFQTMIWNIFQLKYFLNSVGAFSAHYIFHTVFSSWTVLIIEWISQPMSSLISKCYTVSGMLISLIEN